MIPIGKPSFGDQELALVGQVLESGWVVQGPFVRDFEERFERFTGANHAVATTSCTTALHLAMAILEVGPGDEVVVPAFTWVSSANAVEYVGGTPRFADVELDTFNLDPAALRDAITDRTVGILAVHLFGLCADMDAICEVAREHGLWVVEDAACAFGSWHGDRHAGTLGDIGCFSFHPRKSITTGEGGMLTTGRADWAALARSLRDHGASRTDLERHSGSRSYLLPDYESLGFNYRMTDLQAAVGCAQMDRATWILAERTRRARRYDELLEDITWLSSPVSPPGETHGYQAYVCRFQPEVPTMHNVEELHLRRNRPMDALEAAGIATRPGTHSAAGTGYYTRKYGLEQDMFPNAHIAERLSLALPLYPDMTDEDQDRVVRELRRADAGL